MQKETNPEYIKTILNYFKEFLETDFKTGRAPKRQILSYIKGNLSSIDTKRYHNIHEDLTFFLQDIFKLETGFKISKTKFSVKNKKIDDTLNFIYSYNFSDEYFAEVKEKINTKIEKTTVVKYIKEYFLADFFLNIPLSKEEKEEKKLLNDKIYEYIKYSLKQEQEDINEVSLVNLKNEIKIFFEQDLKNVYDNLCDIISNKEVLFGDKSRFYLYFYSINFEDKKYPMFYIPIDIDEGSDISINPYQKVYLNKKAIHYVFKKLNVDTVFLEDRMFYDWEKVFILINTILSKLNKPNIKELFIPYSDSSYFKDNKVTISSSINIQLFEESDESIVNDYEELLQDGNEHLSYVVELVENYLNPKNKNTNIRREVEYEWTGQRNEQKLIHKSPINLSPEQKKILMALKNNDCKTVLVQGPPGTGKSHTITSIIFDYISNNKSVLVLSDKKEALEVVKSKINKTLDFCREDKNIFNSILRIGVKNNNILKITKKSHIELLEKELVESNDVFEKNKNLGSGEL